MRRIFHLTAALLGSAVLVSGCDKVKQVVTGKVEVANTAYPERVYWGDTHLHTSNSPDAFGLGNRLDPEEALRFARGEEVTSSTGIKARLARPLDFLVITDHSDGFATIKDLYNAPRSFITHPTMRRWYDMMHEGPEQSRKAVGEIIEAKAKGTLPKELINPVGAAERLHKNWTAHVATVERYNEPGKFTAFLGFEYTLMNGGSNLHRNVVFRDSGNRVADFSPIASFDTTSPDGLWDWLDTYEKQTGGKALTIPHNSNLSNGEMFMMTEPSGAPMSGAYARRRAAREPLVEITQIKGDSESHPFMSPNDEFASYGDAGWELGNLDLSVKSTPEMQPGSYVREALKRGLLIEQRTGQNPYKYGVIGSTDAHTSLSTADDDNFFGKHPGAEPSPTRATKTQGLGRHDERQGWNYLASGYAAVWATSNSREAIFDAMMRKEVYATTGPRMVLRVFGGWDFTAQDLAGDWVKAGYGRGVPMGGTLKRGGTSAPSFIISALKDPAGANLDRVQVVKGWVDAAGQAHEKIFDVSWSEMDSARKLIGGKVPAVGDTVDLAKPSYANTIGAPALTTVWADPEFDPGSRAFYYVRVLEIPTPSWVAYDRIRFNLTLDPAIPLKQQERGYTAPIWYTPG
ncbi:DUF3604 domain-containing protein [Novosphingobium sp.]|uniref:DUF3604 domain-containing protein n=1 Tax=Novosphingobium sp. TaxID=1874826 RepID=UPI00286ACB69|nr:DUF3604 domain-containing protein [Novosphingobium sp.]